MVKLVLFVLFNVFSNVSSNFLSGWIDIHTPCIRLTFLHLECLRPWSIFNRTQELHLAQCVFYTLDCEGKLRVKFISEAYYSLLNKKKTVFVADRAIELFDIFCPLFMICCLVEFDPSFILGDFYLGPHSKGKPSQTSIVWKYFMLGFAWRDICRKYWNLFLRRCILQSLRKSSVINSLKLDVISIAWLAEFISHALQIASASYIPYELRPRQGWQIQSYIEGH